MRCGGANEAPRDGRRKPAPGPHHAEGGYAWRAKLGDAGADRAPSGEVERYCGFVKPIVAIKAG